jgi:phosphate starvation-inducible PhoH-like protein
MSKNLLEIRKKCLRFIYRLDIGPRSGETTGGRAAGRGCRGRRARLKSIFWPTCGGAAPGKIWRSVTSPVKSDGSRRGSSAQRPRGGQRAEGLGIVREQLAFADNATAIALYGQNNIHLKLVERQLGLSLHPRGNELALIGAPEGVAVARSLLTQLSQLHAQGREVTSEDVVRGLQMLMHDENTAVKEVLQDAVVVASKSRPVIPKSVAQQRYLDAIRNEDIVFGIGPAGTGKTYLAMAMAVKALLEKQVRRIVLCRPAVEAGEKLGFLPGSMQDKVNPYLRPLYDALNDLLDMDRAQLLMDRGQIEVAPLAFMRGRTLNDSFVILDEAQNTTGEQMKMFLTRLGYDSKAVVTGDITQVDLPVRSVSGLVEAKRLLSGIPGIEFCHFTEVDVVRHPLVAAIIKAYDRAYARPDRPPPGTDAAAPAGLEHHGESAPLDADSEP